MNRNDRMLKAFERIYLQFALDFLKSDERRLSILALSVWSSSHHVHCSIWTDNSIRMDPNVDECESFEYFPLTPPIWDCQFESILPRERLGELRVTAHEMSEIVVCPGERERAKAGPNAIRLQQRDRQRSVLSTPSNTPCSTQHPYHQQTRSTCAECVKEKF